MKKTEPAGAYEYRLVGWTSPAGRYVFVGDIGIEAEDKPNIFHRFFLRILLGIRWEDYHDIQEGALDKAFENY